MTAPQIAMLESQFLEKALLELTGLPRLSLFYHGVTFIVYLCTFSPVRCTDFNVIW